MSYEDVYHGCNGTVHSRIGNRIEIESEEIQLMLGCDCQYLVFEGEMSPGIEAGWLIQFDLERQIPSWNYKVARVYGAQRPPTLEEMEAEALAFLRRYNDEVAP